MIGLIALALVALVVYFARHASMPLIWLPTGMLIGGALGNIIDRLRHGSVTDFIKLPLGWPPFNLADTMITLGIVVLFLVRRARQVARWLTRRTRSATRTSTCSSSTRPRASSCTRRAGNREGTLSQLLAQFTVDDGRASTSARESSIAWTRGPRA